MRKRILSGLLILLGAGVVEAQTGSWQKHMLAGRKAFEKLRFSEAERNFGEALRAAERSGVQGQSLRVAESLDGMAELYLAEGKTSAAEPLFQRSLDLREKSLGPSHLDLAKSIDALADLYEKEGKHNLAEPMFARAKAIREKAFAEHPDLYVIVDGKLVAREPK
ncbi:MAG: tetratricopeptide repeat protein [Acidobacteriota bacterium]|nr:tetratricopeptide repeat protein [Acidobacteriota bacterium]